MYGRIKQVVVMLLVLELNVRHTGRPGKQEQRNGVKLMKLRSFIAVVVVGCAEDFLDTTDPCSC